MKLTILTSLLIFTLPVFASDTPYTSAFNGVKTVDEAYEKYNEIATQIIADAKKDGATKKEIKQLEKIRNDILENKSASNNKNKTPEESEKTVAERKLTPEEQEKKISELRDNADAMKEKEQSTANKMLGGTTMAATGMGGMQLASALAEQSADNEAEQDMRAYLATFSCKYGNERASGGERDIELPGGNELINLYSEYVALANDLKVRKNALGVKPGIESEAILDSAKTGLYDDEGLEPRTGAYASLARALQNPDGEDAKMWAAQREKTAENLKTGATVAGIGAVGGLVANLAINAKAPKERSAAINAKYASLKKELQKVQDEIDEEDEAEQETCSKYNAQGNNISSCTCTTNNSYWDSNTKQCVTCTNDQQVKSDKTGCEQKTSPSCSLSGNFVKTDNSCSCITTAKESEDKKTCNCKLTGAFNANTCECNDNSTQNGDKCECNNGYTPDNENPTTCIPQVQQDLVTIETINIPDTFFETGKATITNANKEQLIAKIWDTIFTQYPEATSGILNDTCILITGYADRTGNHTKNQTLSEQRAETVAKILLANSDGQLPESGYRTQGNGDTSCTKDKYPDTELHKCRRVDITIKHGACDGSVT